MNTLYVFKVVIDRRSVNVVASDIPTAIICAVDYLEKKDGYPPLETPSEVTRGTKIDAVYS